MKNTVNAVRTVLIVSVVANVRPSVIASIVHATWPCENVIRICARVVERAILKSQQQTIVRLAMAATITWARAST